MRSPIIHFLLLLGLIAPLTACELGGETEEAPENTEQQEEDDEDD